MEEKKHKQEKQINTLSVNIDQSSLREPQRERENKKQNKKIYSPIACSRKFHTKVHVFIEPKP